MNWWARLLRRGRVETRLDAELRDHIERQVADYVATGLSETEARRRAQLEFGGLAQVKELCRDVRGTRWLEELAQDIRYGASRVSAEPVVHRCGDSLYCARHRRQHSHLHARGRDDVEAAARQGTRASSSNCSTTLATTRPVTPFRTRPCAPAGARQYRRDHREPRIGLLCGR